MFKTNPKYGKSDYNPIPEFVLIWKSYSGRECSASYRHKDEAMRKRYDLMNLGICDIKTEKRYFAGSISL